MNITLITDVLPDDNFTAGQVLRHMLRQMPVDTVSIFWMNQSNLNRPPEDALFTIVKEYRFGFRGWLGAFLHRLIHRLGPDSTASVGVQIIITFWLCVRTAMSIIWARRRSSKDDYVWLVLQGEKLLATYLMLSLLDSRRMILQQWDPLSWWMGNRNHRPEVIRLMQRCLGWLQRRVLLNVVPSPRWEAELLAARINVVRVDNFFSEAELGQRPAGIRLSTPEKVNAVFIGQLYANSELDRCLSVVKTAAKRLKKQVVLHYFGSGVPGPRTDMEIIHYGYRPRMEIVAMIAKWDLALLPYPCEAKYAETASLSFPSKSRVYLAAGLPILAYAPVQSSVEEFCSRNYGPYYVNALRQEDVTEFVRNCLNVCPSHVRRRREHGHSVIQEWFSADAEINRLVYRLRA
jgi:hypothetical protein